MVLMDCKAMWRISLRLPKEKAFSHLRLKDSGISMYSWRLLLVPP